MSCLSYIPQSFATDGFQPPIFKLPHSPTICALEPQLDSNFPNLGTKMLSETEYAVLDWHMKLTQGWRTSVWDMNLIRIPLGQQNGFDYSKCDITMTYEPKPKDPAAQLTEVGVTHFEASKAYITIYYLGINQEVLYKSWNSGDWHYWQYTPVMVFTGFLATDPQLQETIRHELGHALGLAHYIVDPDEIHAINTGQRDPPSIMLVSEMAQGVTHYDITPVDVAEVKLIYGNDGFGTTHTQESIAPQIQTKIQTTQTQPSPPPYMPPVTLVLDNSVIQTTEIQTFNILGNIQDYDGKGISLNIYGSDGTFIKTAHPNVSSDGQFSYSLVLHTNEYPSYRIEVRSQSGLIDNLDTRFPSQDSLTIPEFGPFVAIMITISLTGSIVITRRFSKI